MAVVLVAAVAAASVLALIAITLHVLLIIFTPVPATLLPVAKQYTTTPESAPRLLPALVQPRPRSTTPEDAEADPASPAGCTLSIVVPAFNEAERLGVMVDDAMEWLVDPRSAAALAAADAAGCMFGPSHDSHSPSTSPEDGKDFGLTEVRNKESLGSSEHEKANGRGPALGADAVVELLVVDDGSSDGTAKVARELAAKWATVPGADRVEIRVVRLFRNVGKGGTVQHGVLHARGRYILFADADGATRFSDIAHLLAAMREVQDEQGHGMVVGSRAHLVTSDAVVKRSKARNFLMHGFHLFVRTLGVGGIRDTQCGFKLFTRQTAALLFPKLHLARWSFDVELLLLASLISPPIPVKEVPVAWHEVNGSKIRLGWDSIGMVRDLLVLRGNLFFGRWIVPIRQRPRQLQQARGAGGAATDSVVGQTDKLRQTERGKADKLRQTDKLRRTDQSGQTGIRPDRPGEPVQYT